MSLAASVLSGRAHKIAVGPLTRVVSLARPAAVLDAIAATLGVV